MISKFSVKKPYTILVGVIMVIVLGVVSFTKMTTDLLPSINLPYVIVMTTYVGASPETVEKVVTKPVESSMATVSNIENVSSVSSENYSMVVLEFSQTTDMNAVSLEIREKLDQIKSYWDDSVGNPIIMKLNPDMMPVMIAAVGMEGSTNSKVSEYAKNSVVPDLESIEGVASVNAVGLIEESVNVIIRQDRIDAINEQVFGYIDGEMAEKEEDLAEGKKEIEENRADLLDAQKELEDSRREIEDGKADLEKGKKELEDGKRELADKKEETKQKLAEAETKLMTAKADLESAKTSINTQIMTIEKLKDGLKEAQENRDKLNTALTALTDLEQQKSQLAAAIDGLNRQISGIDAVSGLLSSSSYGDDVLFKDMDSSYQDPVRQIYMAATGTADLDNISVGEIKGFMDSVKDTAAQQLQTASDGLIQIDAGLLQITEQAGDRTAIEGLIAQIDAAAVQLNESMEHATMGLGPDAYLETLNSSLPTIESNLEKVNQGLTELYKGNLTAATELANAQAKIDLGEFQTDAAEAQIESGEKQLESGQEQIDSGFEQLEDALDQLKDGEEQLTEAKEDAYASADMKDILTIDTVKSLLAAQNFSMPGGYVTEEGIDYLVRVGDKPEDIAALSAMPIMNPNMDGVDIITLADVADVFMTDNSADTYTNVNGSPGVLLTIQKQTGYSTGDVSDRLKAAFKSMTETEQGLNIITLMDQGIYIDMVMDSILNNVLFGALLAILILIVFLKDLRPTFVIACSIPVSLVTAIVCMYFSGVTLNIISLSGLALGIGMLVDNSIVVIENIYRLRGEGYSMREAAVEGAKEVSGAIMASTLTTVCVFAPIVFTEGLTRQLFVDMGLTIAYSLLASLVIALTVVPAMSSKMLTKTKSRKDDRFFSTLIRGYEKILSLCLRFKPVVLLAVIVIFVGSAAASISRGTAFMPEMESTQATVSVTMPEGTPLKETGDVTDEIVERIRSIDDVVDVGAMAGGSSMSMLTGGGNSASNATDIYLTLKEDKELSGDGLAAKIEELTADIKDAEITVDTSSMDMSALGGSGISVEVRGRELDTLQEIAKKVAVLVEGVEGTADVSDGLEDSTEELRVIIDRDRAIEHGLTVAQVFQQIAAKLADASSATTFETDIKEYDVYVKNASDMELTRETIKKISIDATDRDGKKEKVPLDEIASFETSRSPNSVSRTEQSRYIQVSAGIADGYNVGLVSRELQKVLDRMELPEGYTLVMNGENETINDAMEQVMLMLLLAILFMYLIMVAQFQSLLSPFIIMFTIPLAFTGGFLGLYISGSEVSVIALIGFVMLSGIIVNNGIVLVDYVNQLRADGMGKREAILEAGRTRLRPVLMTALTTILALSTMVFGHDMGAEMARPMAVVTIGGLIYGTLLTLVVVPCIYDLFMREKKGKAVSGELTSADREEDGLAVTAEKGSGEAGTDTQREE